MSFLVDTDICSAHLKGNRAVNNRFLQYTGGLHVCTATHGDARRALHVGTSGNRATSTSAGA